MAHIEIQNLTVSFRAYRDTSLSLKEYISTLLHRKQSASSRFLAINNVSASFNEGERVGIIGRNGAGKSTLLKTICKIYEPTQGSIHIDGRIAPLLEIGAGFHPEFTGKENIYFNGSILGYSHEQLEEIEKEVIEFSELKDFINTPVKYYSTGMYMRLAFSLATTVNPEILILDELFAGGDAAFVKKARDRMSAMIEKSRIMVLVSHDQGLLRSFCDRFIWMDHGEIKADGDPKVLDLYNDAF